MQRNPEVYGSEPHHVCGSDATCSALDTDVALVSTPLHRLDLGHRFVSPSPVAIPATALDHGADHDESCDSQTPGRPDKTVHAGTPVNGADTA